VVIFASFGNRMTICTPPNSERQQSYGASHGASTIALQTESPQSRPSINAREVRCFHTVEAVK